MNEHRGFRFQDEKQVEKSSFHIDFDHFENKVRSIRKDFLSTENEIVEEIRFRIFQFDFPEKDFPMKFLRNLVAFSFYPNEFVLVEHLYILIVHSNDLNVVLRNEFHIFVLNIIEEIRR